MLHIRIVFFSLCFFFLIKNIFVLDNGLARTPPMGWMSWGYYMCGTNCEKSPEKCLDEKLILSVADYFYEEGFQEVGYEYIIIDDCWSERTRDSKGRLVADKKRFPHGMKFLSDYIHSRGLKFGMYTNVANVTCMGYPGSRAHFTTDANTFAAWGVDYLKVDGCFVSKEFLDIAYINFGEALNNSGRAMVYSCSWPYYVQYIHRQKPDYKRIQPHCNLWRNFHDIATSWKAVRYVLQHYENEYGNIAAYHGPGHWNDPDMLIIGTETLTDSQSRIQLAVFAMMSAPLLLSCDITKVTEYEKRLLQNVELIAIAQDPLGEMAKPYKIKRTVTLWVKRHLPMKGDKYHSFSFALVNWDENRSQSVSFKPALYADMNSLDGYSVMDVFSLIYLSNVTLKDSLLITVPPEDVIIYTLYPL